MINVNGMNRGKDTAFNSSALLMNQCFLKKSMIGLYKKFPFFQIKEQKLRSTYLFSMSLRLIYQFMIKN